MTAESTALEDGIKAAFDSVKPGEKVGDLRDRVKNAVFTVANSPVFDDSLSEYLKQHADCFCREAFNGYSSKQNVEDPDSIKDQAIASLQIIFKRVYGA